MLTEECHSYRRYTAGVRGGGGGGVCEGGRADAGARRAERQQTTRGGRHLVSFVVLCFNVKWAILSFRMCLYGKLTVYIICLYVDSTSTLFVLSTCPTYVTRARSPLARRMAAAHTTSSKTTSSVLLPSMPRNAASGGGGTGMKASKKQPAWYGSAAAPFPAWWDDQLRYKVASRLLITMVVCGFLGSFLPVFAVRAVFPGGDAAVPTVGARGGGGGGGGGNGVTRVDDVTAGGGGALLGGDGTRNLVGGALKPCSSPAQATQTGWTRDGSCAWDPSDGGYHEVRPFSLFQTFQKLFFPKHPKVDVKN